MSSLLIVDDERQIRRALSLNFGARGFEVFEAMSGEEALQQIVRERPDLVLLDLGLPGIDGLTVIQTLRSWTRVPLIVLTVRDDERSKVQALDAGADDYVTKPFGMAELVARVRAILRRATNALAIDEPNVVTSSFRLELAARRVFVGHQQHETRLTPIEWAIVAYLVQNPDRLVTYRQLITAVWGPDYQPDHNLLRVHMANIRRKIEPGRDQPSCFVTDAGVGYRFQPDSLGT